MVIPQYSTLAERPVFGQVSVAELNATEVVVNGLEASLLQGMLAGEVRAFDANDEELTFTSLTGNKAINVGESYVVAGTYQEVVAALFDSLGIVENTEVARVFMDWD